MIFGKILRIASFSALCVAGGVFVNSCETDVDIRAPYEDVTLVYGLLNQQDSIHYIKINRAFLGEGDALVYAKERDSSEYDPGRIDARIEQMSDDGNSVIRSYQLQADENVEKEAGVFYSPLQTVYFFTTNANDPERPPLDADREYRLNISIDEGAKRVIAKTPLIQDNDGSYNFQGIIRQLPKVGLATGTQFSTSLPVEWITTAGGKRYQLTVIWKYTDKYVVGTDTTEQEYTVRWPFPTLNSRTAEGQEGMEYTLNGEDFYRFLNSQVPDFDDTPNLFKRTPGLTIDFELAIGGEQLDIYMDVSEPATGVAQEKPQYTNVENGIGIFSCRYTLVLKDKELSKDSIEELIYGEVGQYTNEKGFCDPTFGGPLNDRPCF